MNGPKCIGHLEAVRHTDTCYIDYIHIVLTIARHTKATRNIGIKNNRLSTSVRWRNTKNLDTHLLCPKEDTIPIIEIKNIN